MSEDTVPANRRLEEVVVTGQYVPQTLRKSVFNVRTITADKIAARGATTITQLLNMELGFGFANDNTLGTTDISLMGMNGRTVKVLLDGLPMLDRGDTRESINQIDISQIERIEIVEGPMSTVYGTDALAGVLNIITKGNGPSKLNLNARIQEETAADEYKPFGNKGLHIQNLNGNWNEGKWEIAASMGHYDFQGFGADQYGRAHSWRPKEQWLPSIKVGYRTERFFIFYRNNYLWEKIINNNAINPDNYIGVNQSYNTRRMMHQLQSMYKLNKKLSWTNALAFTDYKRYTRTIRKNFVEQTEELSTGAGEQDTAKFNSLNWRSTVQYTIADQLSIQPGIELNYEKASGQRIDGNPDITDFSFFLSAEYKPVSWVNIRPGIRFVKNSVYDAPPAIPSLNTLFILNDYFTLRASYASGYRAPALRELYFDFQDANHAIFGNPDLKAEKSNSFNVSLGYVKNTKNDARITVDFSTFYNNFNNLINIGFDPNDNRRNMYINIDKNKTTGANMAARLQRKSWNAGIGGLLLGEYNELTDEPDLTDSDMRKFNWSAQLNAELGYKIQSSQTVFNLFYRFTGVHKAYQVDGTNNGVSLGKIDPYHNADFTINQFINKYINLTAGVRNIFDITNVRSTIGGDGVHGNGGPMSFNYGRSYFLTINLNYNSKK